MGTRRHEEGGFVTERPRERAVLAGVHLPLAWSGGLGGDADLPELGRLADTAGADVVGEIDQRRHRPAPGTFLGKGKLEELKEKVEETEATTVIFDNDLSPAQGSNLEKVLDVNVLDRTELILDIFANHASTRQARLQVELSEETVKSFRASSEQVRDRYESGVRPSLDLRLSLSNLEDAEALLQARRQQLDAAVRQLLQHPAARLAGDPAREPAHADTERIEPVVEIAEVLFRQQLGRRHDGHLTAAGDGLYGGSGRHHGFAGTDVALHQPHHGMRRRQIAQQLADHPLLTASAEGKELTLILTSDRGLCGPYNANVIRTAMNHLRSSESARSGRIELVSSP